MELGVQDIAGVIYGRSTGTLAVRLCHHHGIKRLQVAVGITARRLADVLTGMHEVDANAVGERRARELGIDVPDRTALWCSN